MGKCEGVHQNYDAVKGNYLETNQAATSKKMRGIFAFSKRGQGSISRDNIVK